MSTPPSEGGQSKRVLSLLVRRTTPCCRFSSKYLRQQFGWLFVPEDFGRELGEF